MNILEHTAVVYTLTVLLAASVGAMFGMTGSTPHRWVPAWAASLAVLVFVVVAFAVGDHAMWMGPLFAGVVVVVSPLVAALVQREHPSLLAEPYWRRVVLLTFHRRALNTVDREHEHLTPAPR